MDAGYIVVGILVMFTILAFGMDKKLDNKQRKALLPLIVLIGSMFILPIAPVRADNDWGNPLSTTNVMLIAYYEHTSWTLANTSTAFQNYTDHGSYYDGYIRVWQDARDSTYNGSDAYVDVRCRVRTDGWIMAWLDSTENDPGDLVYFGKHRHVGSLYELPVNGTTCSRAIENVFHVTGESFPGYDQIYLYDYSETSTTKLVIMEMSGEADTATNRTFFIVSSATITSIEKCYVVCGGHTEKDIEFGNSSNVVIYNSGAGGGVSWGWTSIHVSNKMFPNMVTDTRYYMGCHGIEDVAIATILWLR